MIPLLETLDYKKKWIIENPCNLKTPTDLEYRADISKDLKLDLWIKREDKMDDLGSGHKRRKLLFVIQSAILKGASTLVTGGSLPSSQCVAVSAMARQFGMNSSIVYSGDTQKRPEIPTGNYLLTKLMATNITWFECQSWSLIDGFIDKVSTKEKEKGESPFRIYPGMADKDGFLGSLDLGIELCEQLKKTIPENEHIHIVAAAGTGTTCAGISLAAVLTGLTCTVHGICIGNGPSSVLKSISSLNRQLEREVQPISLSTLPFQIHQYPHSTVYDHPSDVELKEMRYCLNNYQLIFDANYMVKTYLGLKHLIATDVISSNNKVVLLHSGGHMGLFGSTESMCNWFKKI